MSDENTALVPYTEVGMVMPLASPAQARQAIQAYEALKASIVQPSDIQKIQGRDFLKKAFWRRVATCFGLSLELVSEQRGHDEKGGLFYSVIYKAIAPNGRTMTADGYCSTSEQGRGGWPEHNVRATAHTRAKNRAISDLVGGGEVSADELPEYADELPPMQQRMGASQHQQPATARPSAATNPLFERWQALQSDEPAMRTVQRYNNRWRQMFGHGAPFSDEERATFAAWLEREEERHKPAIVTEETGPAEAEPIPFDLRTAPVTDRGA